MDKYNVSVSLYHDTRQKKEKSNRFPVKIRVYYNTKTKFYPTHCNLTRDEFNYLFLSLNRKPKSSPNDLFQIRDDIERVKERAKEVRRSLRVFSFDGFERAFMQNIEISSSVFEAFDEYIKELRSTKRIGTAISYECAKNSLMEYCPKLKFRDITKEFLNGYSSWFKCDRIIVKTDNCGKEKTITRKAGNDISIGIYLRNLRHIFNRMDIDRSIYPFGGRRGYIIPRSKNLKKPVEKILSVDEIKKILDYKAKDEEQQKNIDYWKFLYWCGGMNIKDLCLLKKDNISMDGDFLIFYRAKTINTKQEQSEVVVYLLEQARDIIKRWGLKEDESEDGYIFRVFYKTKDDHQRHNIKQELVKTINKHMKEVAANIGIDKKITTYSARRAFATVMDSQGTPIELIANLMGNGKGVTPTYLPKAERNKIREAAQSLILNVA